MVRILLTTPHKSRPTGLLLACEGTMSLTLPHPQTPHEVALSRILPFATSLMLPIPSGAGEGAGGRSRLFAFGSVPAGCRMYVVDLQCVTEKCLGKYAETF